MKRLFPLASCLALVVAAPLTAQAQAPDFTRCTTANFFGGAATAPDMSQGLFGGAVGWEMTRRLSAEMTTKWLVPERGAEAFSAIGTMQFALTGRQTFVPFLTLAPACICLVRRRQQRDSRVLHPSSHRARADGGTRQTFTDPAFVAGGGVSLFASRHISVRPEVEVMLVPNDSETYVITSFTVRLAYHFELHRVTPDRRTLVTRYRFT